ncbi:Werner Syndrome-like exonuclease [Sesamum indicum]|uniref:Werner Syndrome-like exonuclease n=1 Tax=Sesamum indicum TaxID=4182 RepID=A0A6I9UHV7_SESIN|nr:Werner Syndrome-like exonuclease [Sesamum indicum]
MDHYIYISPPPSNSVFPPGHIILAPVPCLPDFYSVNFEGELIRVTVAKKAVHIHEWISGICRIHRPSLERKLIVGIDTEWLPNLAPDDDHPVAILQLCVGQYCLIVQLLHADCIPPSLYGFLADPRHVFCGVGVQEDVKKLYDHHGLTVANTADLNDLARLASELDGREYYHMGLKKMALAILGKAMVKPLRVTLSKWDSHNLDSEQVEYAAVDAYVSFQIAFALYPWIDYQLEEIVHY